MMSPEIPRIEAVLFDIDGTLIDTGGAGARSWRWAFERLHGVPADIARSSSAGMTDPDVAIRTFEAVLGRAPSDHELARLFAWYVYRLQHEVETSEGYRVLGGVVETLVRLMDRGVVLGIVSGGLEGSARIKLERGHLNRYFPVGAFGTDSRDRHEITQVAIDRVSTMHGRDIEPGEVIVVATGVSNGDLLRGVRFLTDSARTHSIVMCTRCNWVRFIDGVHFFARERREEVRLLGY